jgi:hypothetical protein
VKIAVLNNSGNVGKTTISRHLLSPRMNNCSILHVESLNDGGGDSAFRGAEFRKVLQEVAILDDAVVDIGSSNIEAVYEQLKILRGAHEEFDHYVVPTVPSPKQQRDTANTLNTLREINIPSSKIRLVFNMVEHGARVQDVFPDLVDSAQRAGIPIAVVYDNEIFELLGGETLASAIVDIPAAKRRLAQTDSITEKRTLATAIGISRLAEGVKEEMDTAFEGLFLKQACAREPA